MPLSKKQIALHLKTRNLKKMWNALWESSPTRGESMTTASLRRKNAIAISLPARGQSTDSPRTVERYLTENVIFPRKKSVQEPDLSAQGESSTAQERDQNIRLNYFNCVE
jgi:hypothetical protein